MVSKILVMVHGFKLNVHGLGSMGYMVTEVQDTGYMNSHYPCS